MKTLILAFSAFFFVMGLFIAFAAHALGRKPTPTPSPTPTMTVVPEPQGAVLFLPIPYYSTIAQRIKTDSAGRMMNEVVRSECFRKFMLSAPMRETDGRTPTQVVDHLQGLSGVIDVAFYYSRFSSAVAYRQPPSTQININTKYLGSYSSDCELAATFAHESLGHALGGYGHSVKWTRQREDTVPYVLGGRKAQYGGDVFNACCGEQDQVCLSPSMFSAN